MLVNLLIGTGLLIVLTLVWFLFHYKFSPHLNRPDGAARITGTCGDTMEVRLKFEAGRVVETSHWTDGCVYSMNCLVQAVELARGKTPEEILDIFPTHIERRVGGLPLDHMHCAALAVQTLHAAVDDHMQKQARPQA